MKKFIIATVFLLTGNQAIAEVYNCNGVYTNNPCSPQTGAVPTSAALKLSTAESSDKKITSKKKSMTHDLAMKISKVNREYKLSYSVTPVEEFCLEGSTSISDCTEKIEAMNEKIDDRVASLETIKVQKKANELQEQKIKQDAENTDVTVIRQVWVVTPTWNPRTPYDRPPYNRPPYERPPHQRPPYQKSPNFVDPSSDRVPNAPKPAEPRVVKPRSSGSGIQQR